MTEAVTAPPPDGYPPLKGAQLVLLTLAVGVSSFMEILDTTIVNVSVPSISGSLGVSPSEGTWAISSYMLAAAVVQPLTGWIGRRFGEVRTFVSSIVLFIIFSALCGLATSMPMLIAGRLMQGLVSGPMMSVAQAVLLQNYPVNRRGLALGLWSTIVIIAPVFGPILGGWITDNLSWPWLFYINVPVGALAAFISWTLLSKRESKKVKQPIDAVGLTLLIIGVGSLQFMLDNGNEKDWFTSPVIITAAVLAVVSLSFFIPWELTDRHPIVDLSLFKWRNFRYGALTLSMAYFAFMGVNVVFPLWLQTTLGYTSTWAGLAVAPVGICALFLAPLLGKNIQRVNLRIAASFAFMVFSSSLFWVASLNEQASFAQMAWPRLWQGVGIAFFFIPLNQIIFSGVTSNELAAAAGLSNFLRTIAGSMSTAVCVWLWTDRSNFHHAVLSEHVRLDAPGFTDYQMQLAAHGVSGTQSYAYIDRVIDSQALTIAANDLFNLLGVVFLLLIPFVWLTKPPFGAPGSGAH